MVTVHVELKPCPWCRMTPDIYMPLHSSNSTDDTWCWCIRCLNVDCLMHPKSPHIALRRSSKRNLIQFCRKIEDLARKWNQGNPFKAYEKKVFEYPYVYDILSFNLDGFTHIKAVD